MLAGFTALASSHSWAGSKRRFQWVQLSYDTYPLVSQILGNPLDHSLYLALSWLVVRIHWAGFGVWHTNRLKVEYSSAIRPNTPNSRTHLRQLRPRAVTAQSSMRAPSYGQLHGDNYTEDEDFQVVCQGYLAQGG